MASPAASPSPSADCASITAPARCSTWATSRYRGSTRRARWWAGSSSSTIRQGQDSSPGSFSAVLPATARLPACAASGPEPHQTGNARRTRSMALTPIRRVVTGNDGEGRSKVVWDGPSPGVHEAQLPGATGNIAGRGHTDFWVWRETPALLDGGEDAGKWDDEFPCPVGGGHLRVVHWLAKTAESPPNDPYKAPEAHGRTWDRGGGNQYNRSYMHKTKSVDYGILLSGERVMELDDCKLVLKPGDVVVDVGAWHLWDSSRTGCMMAFDMFDADFPDGPAGTAQGNDPVMQPKPDQKLPPGVKPARRVVAI